MSDEAKTPESSPEGGQISSGTSEPGAPGSAVPTIERSAEAIDDSPPEAPLQTQPTEPLEPLKSEAAVVPPPGPRPSYVFLGVVAFVTLALDLGTKILAKKHLEDAKSFADRHLDVIPRFLSLTFAKNKGGAWGLLQEEPESVRRPFFFTISLLAVIFIVSLYRRLLPDQTALKWGLPLVLGGALGNLVNRIQYNYVVDFIDVYAKWGGETHHWPTFNVADVAIVAGVGLMAIDMFTSRKPKVVAPAASAEEAHRAP
jgi:signal peptidase II